MGVDEAGTHERLKAHLRELVDPKIGAHRGRIVKNTGDGFLAEFASVVDAVRCATEIQRGMVDREPEVPAERQIRFRIGINLGDVIAEEDDIFGDGVNVAARLEALAEPGGICVSRVVRDQVRDKLDFAFEDLGEQQVKNIARPVHAYHIQLAQTPAPNRSLSLPDAPSLAVLPFQNMTGDAGQDYFVDGIVDEITTAISRLPWLFVIARNSSFTYKDRAVDVKQVARELGVRYVLEGSVRKAGHRVRITGQLIDTTTGCHIWAERFDGTLDDIFELQDQVASSIVGTIEPRLRLSEIKRAARKPATSLDVYDLYLRALALLHKFTDRDCQEAIQLLKQALAIEPSYTPAAAMIGWCRVYQATLAWGQISEVEIEEGVRLARQAIEAGKDDPDALWMAGFALSVLAGEHATASTAINRALALNPNSAHALGASGWVSCFQNQAALAIEALHRAMRLSPLDPVSYRFSAGLAFAHLIAGDYAEAMVWVDRSLREQAVPDRPRRPRYTVAVRMKVVLCAHLGRMEEAQDWLAQLLQLQPDLTIARYKAYAAGLFRRPSEIVAIFVEGLRNAGLPEE